jgi:tetratricopeptide (TPR) repeat protein
MSSELKLVPLSDKIVSSNKTKTALVYHESKTVRTNIARALSDMGIVNAKTTLLSGEYSEVEEIVKSQKPEIIICSNLIDEVDYSELLKLHERLLPDRVNAFFFLISGENSLSSMMINLSNFIDGNILLPITKQNIQEVMTAGFHEKYEATKSVKNFHLSRKFYLSGDFETAYTEFLRCIDEDPNSSMPYVFLGLLEIDKGNKEQALELFQKAMQADAKNYFCLKRYINLCVEMKKMDKAYELNSYRMKAFPLDINDIQQILTIIIYSNKVEDIKEIVKIFNQKMALSLNSRNCVAAGLAICTKVLFKHGFEEEGKQAAKRAFELYPTKEMILEKTAINLAVNNEAKFAMKLLENYSKNNVSDETFWKIQLEIYYTSEQYSHILKLAPKIRESDQDDPRAFKILLESAKIEKLSQSQISQILHDAIDKHPSERKSFEKILG